MKTSIMNKEWSEFVVKEMCPARCGHLRFKLKHLIEKILSKERERIKQGLSDRLPPEWYKVAIKSLKKNV